MSHEDRKPKCECDNPEPEDLTEGLDVIDLTICNDCKGVIE